MIATIIFLGIMGVFFAGMWKAAVKAGLPGWALLVPIYNIHVLLKMTNLPSWWLWGIMFIPFYGLFLFYKLMVATAALYGKSAGFGAGLFFLGFVFWPMLGFGETHFQAVAPPTGGFPVGAALKHA
jgi:hypothetical protein